MTPALIADRALTLLKDNHKPATRPISGIIQACFSMAVAETNFRSALSELCTAWTVYEPMARLYLTGSSTPSCGCDPRLHGCPECDHEIADAANNHGQPSRTALSNAETSISQLQDKVAQAVRDHQTAVTHLRDDFERLRTRVLRRLSRELDLLDEGMGAIRREPPRLHVMLDHGERATSGLREEIKNLEREAQR